MSKIRNLKITLEYDGSRYYGWQIQKDKPTVQGELVRAIREITHERVVLYGAGRTDTGVHAAGQVANFKTKSRLPTMKWPNALNAHVPEDISTLFAEEVSLDFNSQFDAIGKTYRYAILNRDTRSALLRRRAYLVRHPLNVPAMTAAAKHLIGERDFRSLATDAKEKEGTVRRISSFDVSRKGDLIYFTVTGNGFLYNMVRVAVGTLLEVGRGRMPPEKMAEIIGARDRRRAGPTIPAHGLTLLAVLY